MDTIKVLYLSFCMEMAELTKYFGIVAEMTTIIFLGIICNLPYIENGVITSFIELESVIYLQVFITFCISL